MLDTVGNDGLGGVEQREKRWLHRKFHPFGKVDVGLFNFHEGHCQMHPLGRVTPMESWGSGDSQVNSSGTWERWEILGNHGPSSHVASDWLWAAMGMPLAGFRMENVYVHMPMCKSPAPMCVVPHACDFIARV